MPLSVLIRKIHFQAWLCGNSSAWGDRGCLVPVTKWICSLGATAHQPGGSCGPSVSVAHLGAGSSPTVPCTSGWCIVSTSTRSLWITQAEVEVQDPPSTFIIFWDMILKGLVSQISSWSQVLRSTLEEVNNGKAETQPRVTFPDWQSFWFAIRVVAFFFHNTPSSYYNMDIPFIRNMANLNVRPELD